MGFIKIGRKEYSEVLSIKSLDENHFVFMFMDSHTENISTSQNIRIVFDNVEVNDLKLGNCGTIVGTVMNASVDNNLYVEGNIIGNWSCPRNKIAVVKKEVIVGEQLRAKEKYERASYNRVVTRCINFRLEGRFNLLSFTHIGTVEGTGTFNSVYASNSLDVNGTVVNCKVGNNLGCSMGAKVKHTNWKSKKVVKDNSDMSSMFDDLFTSMYYRK